MAFNLGVMDAIPDIPGRYRNRSIQEPGIEWSRQCDVFPQNNNAPGGDVTPQVNVPRPRNLRQALLVPRGSSFRIDENINEPLLFLPPLNIPGIIREIVEGHAQAEPTVQPNRWNIDYTPVLTTEYDFLSLNDRLGIWLFDNREQLMDSHRSASRESCYDYIPAGYLVWREGFNLDERGLIRSTNPLSLLSNFEKIILETDVEGGHKFIQHVMISVVDCIMSLAHKWSNSVFTSRCFAVRDTLLACLRLETRLRNQCCLHVVQNMVKLREVMKRIKKSCIENSSDYRRLLRRANDELAAEYAAIIRQNDKRIDLANEVIQRLTGLLTYKIELAYETPTGVAFVRSLAGPIFRIICFRTINVFELQATLDGDELSPIKTYLKTGYPHDPLMRQVHDSRNIGELNEALGRNWEGRNWNGIPTAMVLMPLPLDWNKEEHSQFLKNYMRNTICYFTEQEGNNNIRAQWNAMVHGVNTAAQMDDNQDFLAPFRQRIKNMYDPDLSESCAWIRWYMDHPNYHLNQWNLGPMNPAGFANMQQNSAGGQLRFYNDEILSDLDYLIHMDEALTEGGTVHPHFNGTRPDLIRRHQ